MSSALTKAIYARLAGTETPALTGQYLTAQQALATLLATDPDTNLPAVMKGNLSSFSIFPCITFRENGGRADPRFVVGNDSTGGLAVDYVFYAFEIWGNTKSNTKPGTETKSQSGVQLSDIDEAFRLLLDRRYGSPKLPLETGDVRSSITTVLPATFYDEKRNASFMLRQIKFHERFAVAA